MTLTPTTTTLEPSLFSFPEGFCGKLPGRQTSPPSATLAPWSYLDSTPPDDTDYLYVYDDDVSRTSVLIVENDPPTPSPKIEPRYPLTTYLSRATYFHAACIHPDIVCSGSVDFDMNIENETVLENTVGGAKTMQGGELYWCVECLGAYQYQAERSWDGESFVEGRWARRGVTGISVPFWSYTSASALGGSAVFLETRRDVSQDKGFDQADKENRTVAHEIAHLFGCLHGDGGVMTRLPSGEYGQEYVGTVLRKMMLLHKAGPDNAP